MSKFESHWVKYFAHTDQMSGLKSDNKKDVLVQGAPGGAKDLGSMQRLSTTNAVTPKGRIINSCTVGHWTVFILIMGTQVSKFTSIIYSIYFL